MSNEKYKVNVHKSYKKCHCGNHCQNIEDHEPNEFCHGFVQRIELDGPHLCRGHESYMHSSEGFKYTESNEDDRELIEIEVWDYDIY